MIRRGAREVRMNYLRSHPQFAAPQEHRAGLFVF
jgi:hypothetical protein